MPEQSRLQFFGPTHSVETGFVELQRLFPRKLLDPSLARVDGKFINYEMLNKGVLYLIACVAEKGIFE